MSDDATIVAGLRELVGEAAAHVEALCDRDRYWTMMPAASDAGGDAAIVGPALRGLLDVVWMTVRATGEYARAFEAVLAQPARTPYACEVLTRAALESASLAVWLLSPGIPPAKRLARELIYRLHGAHEQEKAVEDMLGRTPTQQERREYGESVADVRTAAMQLGLPLKRRVKPNGRKGPETCAGEELPRYGERVRLLAGLIVPDAPSVPYRIYSGVAHAELWGLWRGVAEPLSDGSPSLAAVCIYTAAQGLLSGISITAILAATYLGAGDAAAGVRAWARRIDTRLATFRPPAIAM